MRAVNLIPLDQRSDRALGAGRSHGAVYAVLLVMAGFALMALLYGKAAHTISNRKSEVASLQTRTRAAESQADALAPYAAFIQLQETRTQAVQTLLASRFDWANAVHEVGRVLPAGVSVFNFSGVIAPAGSPAGASAKPTATTGGSVSSSTPPGSVPTITLGGCATGQKVVAQMLSRLRLIEGVSEVQLTSSTVTGSGAAGGGTASGGTGSCPPHDPSYTAQVIFEALPSASTVTAAAAKAKLADLNSSAPSTASADTASTGGKR